VQLRPNPGGRMICRKAGRARVNISQERKFDMGTNQTRAVQRKSQITKTSGDVREIVAIIHERFHVGEVIKDLGKYVEYYKPEFQAAGPELKYLGLAELDSKSPIGWTPTSLLMHFVSKLKTGETSKPLYEAEIFWELLDDQVFGYISDRMKGSKITQELLVGLNLIQEDKNEELVSEDLHNLFSQRYLDKRETEKLPLCIEAFRAVRAKSVADKKVGR
jgi:hypothetical protein